MEDTFRIIEIGEPPVPGDYLTFTIDDNGTRVCGQLSVTAIAELKNGRQMTDREVFDENIHVIRQAAYQMRSIHPDHTVIKLYSYDV